MLNPVQHDKNPVQHDKNPVQHDQTLAMGGTQRVQHRERGALKKVSGSERSTRNTQHLLGDPDISELKAYHAANEGIAVGHSGDGEAAGPEARADGSKHRDRIVEVVGGVEELHHVDRAVHSVQRGHDFSASSVHQVPQRRLPFDVHHDDTTFLRGIEEVSVGRAKVR
ncbi:MAG: hypothetical protein AAF624_15930 [Bacteroidota bacterium]